MDRSSLTPWRNLYKLFSAKPNAPWKWPKPDLESSTLFLLLAEFVQSFPFGSHSLSEVPGLQLLPTTSRQCFFETSGSFRLPPSPAEMVIFTYYALMVYPPIIYWVLGTLLRATGYGYRNEIYRKIPSFKEFSLTGGNCNNYNTMWQLQCSILELVLCICKHISGIMYEVGRFTQGVEFELSLER